MNSAEYNNAIEENNKAIAKYKEAVRLYRSMKTGDAEFLEAKAAYKVAMDAFDVAYANEVGA